MGKRPDRATMADMVALLRARGSFSVGDVSAALGISEKKVDELAVAGKPVRQEWTREKLAREVRRFFAREGRWPSSKDFRSERMRRMGLPSWEGLAYPMTGMNLRAHWNWTLREGAQRRLRKEGLLLRNERLPDNGWVVLQRYLALFVDDITPQEILALPNALIRREGMEKYGLERMVREGFGEEVADDETGKLWRFPGERKDEPLMMLEVVNSTPEPDGSYAHYFLRVPPTMRAPKQAVAWSFGVTDGWEDFKMAVET